MNIKKFRRLALATGVACLSLSGVAQAACPTVSVSQPFKQFNDPRYYVLAPGGGFESGMASWTLNGGSLVSGNESYFLGNVKDVQSLRIAGNGVAVSPSFCVDSTMPTMRLIAKKIDPTVIGQIKVEVLYKTSTGATGVANAGNVSQGGANGYPTWQPSNSLAIASLKVTGAYSAQIRLTADNGGAWQVDDVYVDPRMY